jgi:hypothetical protein
MNMIDWTKPIETMEGRHARKIITTRIEQSHIIFVPSRDWGDIFLVNDSGFRCDDRAIYSKRQEPFIRNVKVKKEGWVNIYAVYKTEEEAKRACADLGRDCHRFVKWEE